MDFLKANYHVHGGASMPMIRRENILKQRFPWELKFLDFPIMCRALIRTDMYPISG